MFKLYKHLHAQIVSQIRDQAQLFLLLVQKNFLILDYIGVPQAVKEAHFSQSHLHQLVCFWLCGCWRVIGPKTAKFGHFDGIVYLVYYPFALVHDAVVSFSEYALEIEIIVNGSGSSVVCLLW